ncbi:MAG: SDR family oxidoreductase [Pseudomonadota bacterium]
MQPGTALITGAAKRIGRAIALELASRGWRIGVHYRASRTPAEALAAEIVSAHGDGHAATLQADLADLAALPRLVTDCTNALGPPTCLVNNASEFRHDMLADMTPETWALHLDVNLRAPVFLSQAFAAALPGETDGAIINLVDQRVLRPTADFFSYGISKAALFDATRMLAQALAPRIRVNAIGPGPVLQSVHQTPEDFASEAAETLLARPVSPEEIAQAIAYILDAPSLTGQMIALDGGQHLS